MYICLFKSNRLSPCHSSVNCYHWQTLWQWALVWVLCGSRCSLSLVEWGWWETESSVTWNIQRGRGTQTPGTPSFWADPPRDLIQNRQFLDCHINGVEIIQFSFIIAHQRCMCQDQTGPLGWPLWGSTRSRQHSFHSTGPARSLESEHSTASRLPHLLPWSHLLSGSIHPVGTNKNRGWGSFSHMYDRMKVWYNCAVIKATITWDYFCLVRINTIPYKIRILTWWLLQRILVLWLAKERDHTHRSQTHELIVKRNN